MNSLQNGLDCQDLLKVYCETHIDHKHDGHHHSSPGDLHVMVELFKQWEPDKRCCSLKVNSIHPQCWILKFWKSRTFLWRFIFLLSLFGIDHNSTKVRFKAGEVLDSLLPGIWHALPYMAATKSTACSASELCPLPKISSAMRVHSSGSKMLAVVVIDKSRSAWLVSVDMGRGDHFVLKATYWYCWFQKWYDSCVSA